MLTPLMQKLSYTLEQGNLLQIFRRVKKPSLLLKTAGKVILSQVITQGIPFLWSGFLYGANPVLSDAFWKIRLRLYLIKRK